MSYSKVRAMTRVATVNNEAALLEMARRSTASQLEKICRKFGQVRDGGRRTVVDESLRFVSVRGTDSGMVRVTAYLFAEEARVVMKGIDAAAGEVSAGSSAGGRGPLNRADGLVALCESRLQEGAAGRAVGMPVQVVLRVDARGLAATDDGDDDGDDVGVDVDGGGAQAAELCDGTGISAETARRLSCDAGLVRVKVDEAGRVLDVGRKTRTIPTAIRRALRLRDGGCRFPGCTNTRFVDGHHVEHWARGGCTGLSNLVELCRRHHRFVHEYGFGVAVDGDDFVFRDASGRVVAVCAPRPRVPDRQVVALVAGHKRDGISIDDKTAFPLWDGAAVDYSRVVDVLLSPG